MQIIKCLSELIEEELSDAAKYIDLAMKWRNEEPDTADLFHELSVEEMGHVDKLHDEVAELIEEYPDVTRNKVAARVKQLIEEGKAHKAIAKVGDKKVTVYALGAATEEE